MRKVFLSCTLVIGLSAFSFFHLTQSAITGRIRPVDGSDVVWTISGKDSARHPVINGSFNIEVRPGIYQLVIDAKDPYKDVRLENLEVKNGLPLDVGEIYLQQ